MMPQVGHMANILMVDGKRIWRMDLRICRAVRRWKVTYETALDYIFETLKHDICPTRPCSEGDIGTWFGSFRTVHHN